MNFIKFAKNCIVPGVSYDYNTDLVLSRLLILKRFSSSFMTMLDHRRKQAEKSILVQVHSEHSCNNLYECCSQHGDVKIMYHYQINERSHYVLVEFQDLHNALSLRDNSGFTKSKDAITVQSPFLQFKSKTKLSKKAINELNTVNNSKICYMEMKNKEFYLYDLLSNSENVSQQLNVLYQGSKLKELETRLRFLTAKQIEMSLTGLFPNVKALPFGSSVNGFGRSGCDLDLVLDLYHSTDLRDTSRFVYQSIPLESNERVRNQRDLNTISNLMQHYFPGCTNIKRILAARVPIIKYKQNYTNVDCDLSMDNPCAVHMAELMYILNSVDDKVSPLVFTVRQWAKDVKLTNRNPGNWVTNFTLTILVIFFLQQSLYENKPILPPIDKLFKHASPNDHLITKDGVNCSFLKDVDEIKSLQGTNSHNLESLIISFFHYYASFDFNNKGISIVTGKPIAKPDFSPLYIVNPLERTLNISKNVSREELERFKLCSSDALWLLESSSTKDKVHWGILKVLGHDNHATFQSSKDSSYSNKMKSDPSQFNSYISSVYIGHKRRKK